jgi:flagellar biosynthetic protein FliP
VVTVLLLTAAGAAAAQASASISASMAARRLVRARLQLIALLTVLSLAPSMLIIDPVVASALMSMGMMMLPPVMVSLPFKLIFFVLLDGWTLVIPCSACAFAHPVPFWRSKSQSALN